MKYIYPSVQKGIEDYYIDSLRIRTVDDINTIHVIYINLSFPRQTLIFHYVRVSAEDREIRYMDKYPYSEICKCSDCVSFIEKQNVLARLNGDSDFIWS